MIYSKKFLLLFLIIFFSITKISKAEEYTEKIDYIMGTFFKIGIYNNNKEKAEKSIKKAFDEIRRLDNIISNYKDNSEINTIIKNNIYPIKISDDLKEIIELSLFFSEKSNGLFDITVEELIKLWGIKDKNFNFPSKNEIDSILKKIGYKNIILNGNYLILKNNISLDFGAIGKGWAIDKAGEILRKENIKSAFIDSRSSMLFIGLPPNSKYWEISIDNSDKILEVGENYSVSTSSNSEQYFNYKGKKYSHIINPKTGYPLEDNKILSCTVISESATDSDALSTILIQMNEKDANLFIKSFKNTSFLKF